MFFYIYSKVIAQSINIAAAFIAQIAQTMR